MTTVSRHLTNLFALTLAGLACAPPLPPPQVGEAASPLQEARRGRAVEPAVLWLVDEDDTGDTAFVGITVDTRGRFPGRFRLRLDEPPPEEAFFRDDEFLALVGDSGLKMATGSVVAARRNAFSDAPLEIPAAEANDRNLIRGTLQEFDLIYLNRDVEPGPVADELFDGQTPRVGYHLFAGRDGAEVPLDTRLEIELFVP